MFTFFKAKETISVTAKNQLICKQLIKFTETHAHYV